MPEPKSAPPAFASGVMRPRVVVVGAGFAGLNLVKKLAPAAVDITLIDRTNHNLVQPLLYQVATAALAPSDIAVPIRAIFTRFRNVRVLMGEVEAVDTAARSVHVRDTGDVPSDILILATGSVYSWFGHDAWQSHSLALKTLDDAEHLRLHVLGAFERAECLTDPAAVRALLSFVVVGGGGGFGLAADARVSRLGVVECRAPAVGAGHAQQNGGLSELGVGLADLRQRCSADYRVGPPDGAVKLRS